VEPPKSGAWLKLKGTHLLVICAVVADYREPIFQDISIRSGLIKNRDAILVEETPIESETRYQSRAFDTYLRYGLKVDISEKLYAGGEVIILQRNIFKSNSWHNAYLPSNNRINPHHISCALGSGVVCLRPPRQLTKSPSKAKWQDRPKLIFACKVGCRFHQCVATPLP